MAATAPPAAASIPRPPTPPRESTHHKQPPTTDSGSSSSDADPELPRPTALGICKAVAAKLSFAAPVFSSSSPEPGSGSGSGSKKRKRVNFQLKPQLLTPITTSSPEQAAARGSALPVKSILKPTAARPLAQEEAADLEPQSDPDTQQLDQDADFGTQLKSILNQLGGGDAGPDTCRLDAYMTLNAVLKTEKSEDEMRILEESLSQLEPYLRRDLSENVRGDNPFAISGSGSINAAGARHKQTIVEILKLLNMLLWGPKLGRFFSDGFQSFVITHSIATVANDFTPKVLVNQYLHLLGMQNLRSRHMTPERAGKLLVTLKNLHERVSGQQLKANRLNVYKKLITQVPEVMSSRLKDWFHHLLFGLLSDFQEVRVRAVSLGTKTAEYSIGGESTSQALMECFAQRLPPPERGEDALINGLNGERGIFGDFALARLAHWQKSKDKAQQVPLICGVIVLLLKNPPNFLEWWKYTGPMLRLLSKCLHSADANVCREVNRTWNNLIFTVSPNATTSQNTSDMLRKFVFQQMKNSQNASPTSSPSARPADFESERDARIRAASTHTTYCNLLYYAFRPGTGHTALERYWREYVHAAVRQQAVSASSSVPKPKTQLLDPLRSCDILAALLVGPAVKTQWLPNRVFELSEVSIDELPRVDPRWVRANAGTVLTTLETVLFSDAAWAEEDRMEIDGEADNSSETPALRVWRAFIQSLADSASKEIKVSNEAASAMAEVMNAFGRWTQQRMPDGRLATLMRVAHERLGGVIFAEKRFFMDHRGKFVADNGQNKQAVENAESLPDSPASNLLRLVASRYEALSECYIQTFSFLLDLSLGSSSAQKGKTDVLKTWAVEFLQAEEPVERLQAQFWEHTCEKLPRLLESVEKDANSEDARVAIGNIVETLGIYADLPTPLPKDPAWKDLVVAAYSTACQIDEKAGMELVVEPVAEFLQEPLELDAENLPEATQILDICLTFIRRFSPLLSIVSSWSTVEGQLQFGKTYDSPLRVEPLVGMDMFYKALNSCLMLARECSCSANDHFVEFLQDITILYEAAPSALFSQVCQRSSSGVGCWIADTEKLLDGDGATLQTKNKVVALWSLISSRIEMVMSFDRETLQDFEQLLLAGLTSEHQEISESAKAIWEDTFLKVDGLEIPAKLQQFAPEQESSSPVSEATGSPETAALPPPRPAPETTGSSESFDETDSAQLNIFNDTSFLSSSPTPMGPRQTPKAAKPSKTAAANNEVKTQTPVRETGRRRVATRSQRLSSARQDTGSENTPSDSSEKDNNSASPLKELSANVGTRISGEAENSKEAPEKEAVSTDVKEDGPRSPEKSSALSDPPEADDFFDFSGLADSISPLKAVPAPSGGTKDRNSSILGGNTSTNAGEANDKQAANAGQNADEAVPAPVVPLKRKRGRPRKDGREPGSVDKKVKTVIIYRDAEVQTSGGSRSKTPAGAEVEGEAYTSQVNGEALLSKAMGLLNDAEMLQGDVPSDAIMNVLMQIGQKVLAAKMETEAK